MQDVAKSTIGQQSSGDCVQRLWLCRKCSLILKVDSKQRTPIVCQPQHALTTAGGFGTPCVVDLWNHRARKWAPDLVCILLLASGAFPPSPPYEYVWTDGNWFLRAFSTQTLFLQYQGRARENKGDEEKKFCNLALEEKELDFSQQWMGETLEEASKQNPQLMFWIIRRRSYFSLCYACGMTRTQLVANSCISCPPLTPLTPPPFLLTRGRPSRIQIPRKKLRAQLNGTNNSTDVGRGPGEVSTKDHRGFPWKETCFYSPSCKKASGFSVDPTKGAWGKISLHWCCWFSAAARICAAFLWHRQFFFLEITWIYSCSEVPYYDLHFYPSLPCRNGQSHARWSTSFRSRAEFPMIAKS